MDYRETISAELPAPRDDEPASVRQDIIDELADHLTSAYHHELLRGADTGVARARVLERFGDPAAVARRLWFDAIGGKFMAQRIVVGTCLIVALASLALAGLMGYRAIQVERELARANAEAMKVLYSFKRERQASQVDVVKQLREMSETLKGARSFDWNPVSVVLTEGAADGRPLEGMTVTLREQAFLGGAAPGGAGAVRSISRPTDSSGIADFGVVHPGQYALSIQTHWTGGTASGSCQLTVEPGSRTRKQIICPVLPRPRLPVRVRAAWPPDLKEPGLVLYARFCLKPLKKDQVLWNYHEWRTSRSAAQDSFGMQQGVFRSTLSGPDSSLVEILRSTELYLWGNPDAPIYWADVRSTDLREIRAPEGTLEWEQGSYRLVELFVLRPLTTSGGAGRRHFEILAASFSPDQPQWQRGLKVSIRVAAPPTDEELAGTTISAPTLVEGPTVDLPAEYWKSTNAFEASFGATNAWVIPLPAELIERLRTGAHATP